MIVVKVGGGTTLNIDAVVADIVELRAKGTELLLVHGGAQTTNAVAEALHLTPSAVSQQISQLEDGVGVALTERRGRGVRLTHAGEVLAQHADQVMAALLCSLK